MQGPSIAMTTPIRLAVFAFDLGASFIEKHLSQLAPGATVAVGAYGGNKQLAELWPVRCPVLNLAQARSKLLMRLLRRAGIDTDKWIEREIIGFLKQHRINVALGEYLDEFMPYVQLLNRLRIPYLVQGHGIDVSAALSKPAVAIAVCETYKSAHVVLTRSEFHRQRLIKLGLPETQVAVNFGGVDVPERPLTRAPSAATRFLAMGRMVAKKAPMHLLEAFRQAVRQNPQLHLDYIGAGPFFEAVEEYVRATDLSQAVTLHGVTSESHKLSLMSECGVFVQHSMTARNGDEEGLPAAIQEAMAQAMAVVSTRHTGIAEAVIENKTGLLVDEGDVTGMSQSMLKIVPQAYEFGLAGYQEAVDRHAWCHERDRLKAWLQDCLHTRSAGS